MSKINLETVHSTNAETIVTGEVDNVLKDIEKLKAEIKTIKDKYDYGSILEHLHNAECKLHDGKMSEFMELLTPKIETFFKKKITGIDTDIKFIREKLNKFSKIKYEFYLNRINNKQISVSVNDSKNVFIVDQLSTNGALVVGDNNTIEK
jgi:hypothetical protein